MMCLLGVAGLPTDIQAQNFDANRMNRDISIMEGILAELFRTQYDAPTSDSPIFDGGAFRVRGIRGTYLSEYGIIFMIPGEDPMRPRVRSNGRGGYSFYYNSDDDTQNGEVDQDAIVSRITEFLMNYGSTIGQLDNDDRIMVIYGATTSGRRMNLSEVLTGQTVADQDEKESPVVSVSVSAKALKDYRRGDLTSDAMKDEIEIAASEGKEYPDLKVMGNIYETALRDNDGYFRMMGSVSYLMLDNFGAIFSFDVRYTTNREGILGFLNGNPPGGRFMGQGGQGQEMRGNPRNEPGAPQPNSDIDQEELEENILKAYDTLRTNIKEYLVDYGRTLMSVDSQKHILTSLEISGIGVNSIPERVDFQIKKSVLEDLDKGRISREEAIKKVVVTEF